MHMAALQRPISIADGDARVAALFAGLKAAVC